MRPWRGSCGPPRCISDCLQRADDTLFTCVVNSKLNSVCASERCSFVYRQFARKVLLELCWRTHTMIAETDSDRGMFLSYLICAMAALCNIRNRSVNPRIRNV